MALTSIFLLLRRPKPLASSFTAARSMGGGPRTFPGGLNKWKYKRMHEKLAKEKEHKLLHQEKQLYQARLRSEIRAKLVVGEPQPPASSSSNFTAMSSKDHIKALADRFTKRGAEDLWNVDDGPIKSEPAPLKPLDLKKIVKDARSLVGKLGSFEQRRGYSKLRINLSSDDDEDEDEDGGLVRRELKISRFFGNGKEEEESDKEEKGFGGRSKKMMSGASLRNFDRKKERRVSMRDDVEQSYLFEEIREMREEIKNRESTGGRVKAKEESVLTQKRFDEYNISPLTIKALNAAGFVQMTVVQEVTLPVCLEDPIL